MSVNLSEQELEEIRKDAYFKGYSAAYKEVIALFRNSGGDVHEVRSARAIQAQR